MASAIFAVLDDIATLMDDAATITKVATQKTAGVLGDDLAVGADKASKFSASRELPVLWGITKGSFINKLIILPIAFLLSAFAPWLIIPILVTGGLYLAYEGAEKIVEWLWHKPKHTIDEDITDIDPTIAEKKKIKSAIHTDFILSIEIIVIALSTTTNYSLTMQIFAVTSVAIIATVGVYGIVALLVRMDDMGFWLIRKAKNNKSLLYYAGNGLVLTLPKIIKLLAVVGTIAMLMVGGGIFNHHISSLHHLVEKLPLWGVVSDILSGLIAGIITIALIELFHFFKKDFSPTQH